VGEKERQKPEAAATDPYADRKKLTFELAEGAEPLPSQLKPKELSQHLRALLWEAIYKNLERSRYRDIDSVDQLLAPWETIFYTLHVDREHKPADEFENDFEELAEKAKSIITTGDYLAVFGWIQYVLRCGPPGDFAKFIQRALERGHAAYRIVDNDTIVPFGSVAEQAAIEKAFADLSAIEFHGARKHLRGAAEQLTTGKNADSVRESIHAVESVVRVLEPRADFAKALAKLEAKTKIHGALKAGFNSIYGFTSDENGIRHPLLDKGDANVDEADALFMIGACAAFVSYLINKARAAGIL
jgi:thiaminase